MYLKWIATLYAKNKVFKKEIKCTAFNSSFIQTTRNLVKKLDTCLVTASTYADTLCMMKVLMRSLTHLIGIRSENTSSPSKIATCAFEKTFPFAKMSQAYDEMAKTHVVSTLPKSIPRIGDAFSKDMLNTAGKVGAVC
ncbi:uncharacterized protein EV154DRAFT_484396 [Mucor mucedo]|uniref:uncharacterized protein n=1 Tax=Mucor mucedo TaxID=29922 RepID=UPI00221E6824|nr:uncharacterized protein EV154DRAFT_484396 [Mucor mucedo]KAI7888076.1 hypothetical protein EV154DRAFT_484396 [Mucor mucedo]